MLHLLFALARLDLRRLLNGAYVIQGVHAVLREMTVLDGVRETVDAGSALQNRRDLIRQRADFI